MAFLLNGSTSDGNPVWRQNLDNDAPTKDAYPVLDASHGVVYQITDESGTRYSNYPDGKPDTGGDTGGSSGSSSGGSHRPARDEGPSTGASDGWKDIQEEIRDAEKGDTITIDMNGETEVPGEIFEEVAGKDVTVEVDMGDVTWTVNGEDVPERRSYPDFDLGVDLGTRGIPANVFNAITREYGTVQFTLAHDGNSALP